VDGDQKDSYIGSLGPQTETEAAGLAEGIARGLVARGEGVDRKYDKPE
jgi:hypothetical protein